MKAKGAAGYGVLAAAGLVAAFVTSKQGPERKDRGDVVVLDLKKKEVLKVRYEDGKKWAELGLGQGDEGGVWVTELLKPAPPAPADPHAGVRAADGGTLPPALPLASASAAASDGGTSLASATQVSEPPPVPRQLRGNEQAKRTLESFAPLLALRELGKLDDKKLEDLGLLQSQRTVTVSTPAGEQSFTVGYPPSGVSAAYFQSKKDGTVYLLGSQLLGDLEFASNRLVERRLHSFEQEDADAVELSQDGRRRRFSQVGGKLFAEGQSQADDFARNWHDRVWRFVPAELLGRGQVPPSGAPQPLFRVDYFAKGKALGFAEVARRDEALYVRTEFTAGWVRTHAGAGDLLGEAKKVLAGP